ncbi:MAG: 2-hydroxychromene-2-carboxylate isomerase [Hyphomicrobiales bacterium]
MTLTFWFDVHSPWAYLAAHRVGDLARRHGHGLTWKPLHLPRLLEATGGFKPLEAAPQRVAWFQQDIRDHAELLGLPLAYHPQYPLRNARALRACQFAADEGRGEAFACRVMRAYWSEAGNIEDLAELARWGEESGLDGVSVSDAAVSETYKQKVELNTEAARTRGIFGVPTIDTGAKLYFGNDRLDLLDLHLRQSA